MSDIADMLRKNAPYVSPHQMRPQNTPLGMGDEMLFRGWLAKNNVPFDPEAQSTDYDMRGFYKGLQSGDPRAQAAVDPNDSRLHYPDFWKTPAHQTFSNESQWAKPMAPQWTPDDKLAAPSGRILYDDRNPNPGLFPQ